jgi:hypothetical protein
MRTGWVGRRSCPWQHRLRALPVWLVALALFSTTLPLHSGLEQHEALDGPTKVWLTQCKPGPLSHLEAATSAVELPRCLACVLQLQTLGAVVPAPHHAVALPSVGLAALPGSRPPDVAPLRLAPSRGPPRA